MKESILKQDKVRGEFIMAKELVTVTGETLMAELLPQINMIVDGLIPQGLHILGGAPKVGKHGSCFGSACRLRSEKMYGG